VSVAADPAAIEFERRFGATLQMRWEFGRDLIGAPAAECLD
jgi:hypothetical protein